MEASPVHQIERIVSFRRELHRYPEVSGKEEATARRVQKFLEDHTSATVMPGIGGHGLVAVFEFGEGPGLLFRAELDALPIQEGNSFEHRSQNPGISHKCGHDGHTSILLGIALQLEKMSLSRGRLILLFQPSEEDGTGALEVLADSRFQELQVDYAFALHNLPGEEIHQVITAEGEFNSTVQSVAIFLEGSSSHASEPEKGLNPAESILRLMQGFGELAVPEQENSRFSLLTPVHIKLGEANYGISPGKGELHYTLRCHKEEQMQFLREEVEMQVQKECRRSGLKCRTEWFDFFPSIRNNRELNALVVRVARDQGFTVEERNTPFRFGEDFSWFSKYCPAVFFGLGAGISTPALHSEAYDFPDPLLESGIRMFQGIAKAILKPENQNPL